MRKLTFVYLQYTIRKLLKAMKMRKILFFLLLFLDNMLFAQMNLEKDFDQLLHQRFEKNQAGIAVMIVKEGKVLYKKELEWPIWKQRNLLVQSLIFGWLRCLSSLRPCASCY